MECAILPVGLLGRHEEVRFQTNRLRGVCGYIIVFFTGKDMFTGTSLNWRLYLTGGFLVGFGLLWLLLRQVDINEFLSLLASLDFHFVIAALLFYGCALILRSWRWQNLLSPLARVRYSRVFIVMMTGYAVNNLLPARIGEIFRASLSKSMFGVSGSAALGTIAVERTIDGLAVVSLFVLGTLALPVSGEHRGLILGALIAGAILFSVVAIVLYFLSGSNVLDQQGWWQFAADKIRKFRHGLGVMRSPVLPRALCLSGLVIAADACAIWSILAAAHVYLTALQLALVFGISSLSMLLPTAPGYVGTLQFAYVIAVTSFGFSAAQGLAAASAAQLFLLVPQTLIGIFFMIGNHIEIAVHLRREALQD